MPRLPPVTRVDRLISAGTSHGRGACTVLRSVPGHGAPGPLRPAGSAAAGPAAAAWDRLPVVADNTADRATGSRNGRVDPEFTAHPLHELAATALQRAADLGAQHADFRAERIRGQQIGLSDGNLETLFDGDDLGLAVRVVLDGTWGFASAVDLTQAAALRAAEEAVEVAKVAAAINTERIELRRRARLRRGQLGVRLRGRPVRGQRRRQGRPAHRLERRPARPRPDRSRGRLALPGPGVQVLRRRGHHRTAAAGAAASGDHRRRGGGGRPVRDDADPGPAGRAGLEYLASRPARLGFPRRAGGDARAAGREAGRPLRPRPAATTWSSTRPTCG